MRSPVLLPILAAAALVANGPCAMFPGGEIEGVRAPHPASWDFLGAGTRCELEVDPPSPRSVTIDCYTYSGQLYVHSHRLARLPRLWAGVGEAWVTAAERDPRVRLGRDGRIYELRAVQVTDPVQRRAVLESRGFEPVPEGIELFALVPRADPAPAPASPTRARPGDSAGTPR